MCVYVHVHVCVCACVCTRLSVMHDEGELTSSLCNKTEDIRGLRNIVVVHDGNGDLHGSERKQVLHCRLESDPDARRQGVLWRNVPLPKRVFPVTLLPELDLKR